MANLFTEIEELLKGYEEATGGKKLIIKKALIETMEPEMRELIEKGEYSVEDYISDFLSIITMIKLNDAEAFTLPAELKEEIETIFKERHESDRAYINDSPIVKKMLRSVQDSKQREVVQLSNKENAVFTLIEGYLDPYEKEILEVISKYKLDGQVTQNGKTFCTVGQLYRGLRGGVMKSPTAAQQDDIMATLKEMSKDERKLHFELNEYLQTWGGFETNGGKIRLVSYDEFYGQIRGQNDTLIVFDDTPVLCMVSENLKMYEIISQDIKAIQYENDGKLKTYALSKKRIAIRSVVLSFVFSYIRARTAGKQHSPKLPYKKIFELCNINESQRQEVIRRKKDIAIILDHLKRKGVITGWKEYKNAGGTVGGVEIRIAKELNDPGKA